MLNILAIYFLMGILKYQVEVCTKLRYLFLHVFHHITYTHFKFIKIQSVLCVFSVQTCYF